MNETDKEELERDRAMTCDPKDNQKIDAVVLQVSNPTKNGRH